MAGGDPSGLTFVDQPPFGRNTARPFALCPRPKFLAGLPCPLGHAFTLGAAPLTWRRSSKGFSMGSMRDESTLDPGSETALGNIRTRTQSLWVPISRGIEMERFDMSPTTPPKSDMQLWGIH